MLRVVIVDDHRIFREGLATALTAHGILVDGLASTHAEAIAMTRDLRPHIVLMDGDLALVGGLQFIRTLRAQRPSKCVLMLSRNWEPRSISEVMKAGASGYVLKQDGIADLVKIISACSRGEPIAQPCVANKELASAEGMSGQITRTSDDMLSLSHKEQIILNLVVSGATNDEIAHALHISVNTVKVYLKQLFEKLGVQNRTQAAVLAVQRGLFDSPH